MLKIHKGDYITAILRSQKTVFTFRDISLIWGESGSNATRVRINYYVRSGRLLNLRRGLYAKDQNYNKLELATKIFVPSYVSFETVLTRAGIIFQYYDTIFVASYLTRSVVCDSQKYSFRKIKPLLLTNRAGVENKNECSIATVERAFLDTLYINKNYYFDNLAPLDWEKVFALLHIYQNKNLQKKVHELHENFQEDR